MRCSVCVVAFLQSLERLQLFRYVLIISFTLFSFGRFVSSDLIRLALLGIFNRITYFVVFARAVRAVSIYFL